MTHSWKKLIAALVILIAAAVVVSLTGIWNFRTFVMRAAQKVQVALVRLPTADVYLPVVFDRQDHALSCEVATLKMALAYRGVNVDENQLIARIGTDPVAKQTANGKITVWGDPQKAFVGNINGRMPATGYGVYWQPIEKAAADYRPARAFSGGSVADLITELRQNNPVIIWAYLGSGKPFSWQTPDQKPVHAVYYEHTFVVNGFKGTSDNPEGFFLVDPIYGRRYWPLATFTKRWASFNNSGVIIY